MTQNYVGLIRARNIFLIIHHFFPHFFLLPYTNNIEALRTKNVEGILLSEKNPDFLR